MEDPLTLGKFEEKKVPESSMAKLRKMTESSLEYTIHLIRRVDHVISC